MEIRYRWKQRETHTKTIGMRKKLKVIIRARVVAYFNAREKKQVGKWTCFHVNSESVINIKLEKKETQWTNKKWKGRILTNTNDKGRRRRNKALKYKSERKIKNKDKERKAGKKGTKREK